MATRANIIIQVPANRIGTTVNFDPSKLHTIVGHWDKQGDEWTAAPHDCKPRDPMVISGKFLSIYSHWDGYPTHLGQILLTHYNDLDKALNLLAGGWIDAINERYYNAFHDTQTAKHPYDFNAAQFPKNPGLQEAYAYLYKGGEWYVTTWKLRHGTRWARLADVLASNDPDLDND